MGLLGGFILLWRNEGFKNCSRKLSMTQT
jgi:hypothetical protein